MSVTIPTVGPKRQCAYCEMMFFIPIVKWRVKGTNKYRSKYSHRKYCDRICESIVHSENRISYMKTMPEEELSKLKRTHEELMAMNAKRWENYAAAGRVENTGSVGRTG